MESYEGRVLKKIKQLTSPSTNQRLNENDILKFHFAPTEVEHWMHKPHPFEAGSPCFQPQQVTYQYKRNALSLLIKSS